MWAVSVCGLSALQDSNGIAGQVYDTCVLKVPWLQHVEVLKCCYMTLRSSRCKVAVRFDIDRNVIKKKTV